MVVKLMEKIVNNTDSTDPNVAKGDAFLAGWMSITKAKNRRNCMLACKAIFNDYITTDEEEREQQDGV